MSRKSRSAAPVVDTPVVPPVSTPEPVVEETTFYAEEPESFDPSALLEGLDTLAEKPVYRGRSVVRPGYKAAYRARGDARGNSDWLQQTMKDLVLDREGKLDVWALTEICQANGVDPSYSNRSPGWQGRMRMTLGLKLRPIVARQGFLVLGDGQKFEAPEGFRLAWRK